MSVTLVLSGFDEVIKVLDGMDIPRSVATLLGMLTEQSARFAASITPVDTGAMRRSWKGEVQGLEGRVFVYPMAVNPHSGAMVRDYAGIVDERVGISMAVADRATRMAVSMMGDFEWISK